jgi:hypothetical protein
MIFFIILYAGIIGFFDNFFLYCHSAIANFWLLQRSWENCSDPQRSSAIVASVLSRGIPKNAIAPHKVNKNVLMKREGCNRG